MLNVILVGSGFMGRMHASVYGLLPNAQVVAVVDIRPDVAKPIAGDAPVFSTLAEALSAVEADAVDVCLPTYLHKEFSIEAAKAGKHVICEKPMALSLADADEMIKASETAGVRLMIAHCIRFWPEYALLKQIVDENRLGKLTSLNMTRYGAFPAWSWDGWLADESRAGGAALDMHIHDTDYSLYLLGEPLEVVSHGTDDGRGIGQIYTTLRYSDGAVAHLQGGWNLPSGAPFKMEFRAIFEKGAVIFEGGPLTIYEEGKEPVVPEFPKMEAAGGGNISNLGGYYHELKAFVDHVLDGTQFVVSTPQTSRASLALVLEEIRLAKIHQP